MGPGTAGRYTAGVPEKLRPPAGRWTFESAGINATGDIVANATRAGSPAGRVDAVLLWKAGSSTAVTVPLPARAEAMTLTDTGMIVGSVVTRPGIEHLRSYVWDQQGNGRELPAPADQTASVHQARGDWATGNLWPSGAVARWNLATGDVSELPVDAPGHGINARGRIAGGGTVLREDATVELVPADGVRGDPQHVADSGLVVGGPSDGSSGVITWRCDG